MENDKKDLSRQVNWISLKTYADEVTYNKIHRHLTDINDVISEEDIRNVKIFTYAAETELAIATKQVNKSIN